MIDCIFLCKARDGSTTLRDLFYLYYEKNAVALTEKWPEYSPEVDHLPLATSQVKYVHDTFTLWQLIVRYVETGNAKELVKFLNRQSGRVQITHGFAFMLPIVAAVFGRDVKIVQVKRSYKTHVESLVKRVKINPNHWVNYSDVVLGKDRQSFICRPTAFHFGEMSSESWDNLSIHERFSWFVEKQDALVDQYRHVFKNIMEIKTEELSDIATVKKIFNFVFEDETLSCPDPIHVHKTAGTSIDKLKPSDVARLEQFWEQIDYNKLIVDRVYATKIYAQDLKNKFPEKVSSIDKLFDEMLNELE